MRVLLWPNVLWDELPEPVAPTDNNAWSEGFDAMFQIGFHARAGTANGFVGHTIVPGLRVAVDGAPVTECQSGPGWPDFPFLTVKRTGPREAAAFRSFFEDWVEADEPT
jgi:D-aminopeptidase